MSDRDTIAAIATAPGSGGVAIVRISGERAYAVADLVFHRRSGRGLPSPRRVYLGTVVDTPGTGGHVDHVIAFGMRAPHSYTGEDVVEIQCHGGNLVSQRILEAVCAAGARPAEPGEFTKRAFLNGRIDLAQAEAIADLIAARSEAGRRLALSQLDGNLSQGVERLRAALVQARARCEVALDFPEEDLPEVEGSDVQLELGRVRGDLEALAATFERGRLRYEGARVALVGRPNVGKSSLLNALVGRDRAIVTPVPGTTRDVLEAVIVIDGSPVVLLDTAGLRACSDVVEAIGVERTRRAVEDAACVLAVFDASVGLHSEDAYVAGVVRPGRTIGVINKTDLGSELSERDVHHVVGDGPLVRVSAVTQEGFSALTAAIAAMVFDPGDGRDAEEIVLFRARHRDAVRQALSHVFSAERALEEGSPLELVAIDLGLAAAALSTITGAITSEDVLDRVFADFCLGK